MSGKPRISANTLPVVSNHGVSLNGLSNSPIPVSDAKRAVMKTRRWAAEKMRVRLIIFYSHWERPGFTFRALDA